MYGFKLAVVRVYIKALILLFVSVTVPAKAISCKSYIL